MPWVERTFLRLAQLLIIAAMLASACAGGESSLAVNESGEWPLNGEVALVDGAQLELGDLEGQDLVLWFWAPW